MKRIFLFGCTVMLALASCETGDGNGPVEPAKPIDIGTRGAEKIAADNDFAFKFFRETIATAPDKDKANAFVSPLSLTMALGMLYNGTSPDAATEMARALGMEDFTAGEINSHYKTLVDALLAVDPRTALAIANSIWARESYPVKPTFYDMNKKWYNAEVQSLPFDQAAVDKINKWCADNTAGRIPKILEPPIPFDAIMYLINAVYFKGQWKFQFDKAKTHDADFTLADGSRKSVKMMNQSDVSVPCYRDNMLQCVDLPYGNGAFSMMVVLPAFDNTLDDLVTTFDADKYSEIEAGLQEMKLTVAMPRWKQECEFKLVDAVVNLGMKSIFDPDTHPLVGIADEKNPLYVSEIRQKTFVEVNEEGTEAAAVTIGNVMATSAPTSFIADRPFLYLIRERSTGAILFIGRMDDPGFS
jgi:serpin B